MIECAGSPDIESVAEPPHVPVCDVKSMSYACESVGSNLYYTTEVVPKVAGCMTCYVRESDFCA